MERIIRKFVILVVATLVLFTHMPVNYANIVRAETEEGVTETVTEESPGDSEGDPGETVIVEEEPGNEEGGEVTEGGSE
ncbi:MAG: hypothetical protein IKF68_06975, partial [Erysipelotrichaceae bacterium]|nr:hypothetical protein [Erysipelotrichaceae bacterium]